MGCAGYRIDSPSTDLRKKHSQPGPVKTDTKISSMTYLFDYKVQTSLGFMETAVYQVLTDSGALPRFVTTNLVQAVAPDND